MKHSLLETAIGAVVLVAALVFLVYSYGSGNGGTRGLTDGRYRLIAEFANVGGLKTGDNVMISGVKVGAIEKIDLDNRLYRARVTFSVNDAVKLARDSSARIASESLLGGRYLDLQPGGDDQDLRGGDKITITQSATNLEDLLGRFIFGSNGKSSVPGLSNDAPGTPGDAAPAMPSATDGGGDHP